jgi:hypothetical protein
MLLNNNPLTSWDWLASLIIKDMKKTISFLSLLFGLFVCVAAFSACGGDDEPSSGGNNGSSNNNQTPSNPQSTKHIVKIITEKGNTFIESSLFYDSQGRVRKIIETKSSSSGQNRYSETEYKYGEMLIISKKEDTYSGTGTSSNTHSYTLENGLIVKDEGKGSNSSTTETFSYDANNYLSSINTKMLTWSDGNLTKAGDRTYSYTNYSWAKGFPLYLESVGVDEFLFANGYFGNIPKNLPETYHSYVEFVYTLEGNYVTKTILFYSGKTQTMTYIWE